MPDVTDAAALLLARMTLREKLAQLVGLWAKARRKDEVVAPMQDRLLADTVNFEAFARDGLGQFTRHYGTRPVEAAAGRAELDEFQGWLAANTRLGIPAVVHEECLTGVLAWGATAYPTPLAWGASFDPELVEGMARRIGSDMRELGIHQGLAPVLDVVRDARWGRVEECIGEDPVLVGAIGTAYVAGLEAEGRIATLKHFVGYSGSRGGRNHGPVSAGPRELREIFLPPFEQAIRDGGARSVMNSYTELDGIPAAADEALLTGILRDEWGFDGTVVADYFAVTFLQTMHGVARDLGDAAITALAAGIDVELPTGSAYLEPLEERAEGDARLQELIDRSVRRILLQKQELGLLDGGTCADGRPIDLDSPENRAFARALAEESIVLLANDGTLPVAVGSAKRVAIVGPNARADRALLGCYSFENHVLPHHPDIVSGPRGLTVAEALIAQLDAAEVVESVGCEVMSGDASGIPAAAELVAGADLAFVVVGDVSGMFGRGTSGEGCDVATLDLPGVQRDLVEACLATGTRVVLVLVTGRPYVLDGLADRAAAVIQAFLPGQEGAAAIAGVVTGRVVPSGRLPVELPTAISTQPSGYLAPQLGRRTSMSSADPTPKYPFGFGLSYTAFEYGPLSLEAASVPVDGTVALSFTLTNTGDRAGTEVVQVYASDPVASVTRPVRWLAAFGRVTLDAGASAIVRVELDASVFSLVDRSLSRVVEPGEVTVAVGRNARDLVEQVSLDLVGEIIPATWTGASGRRVLQS